MPAISGSGRCEKFCTCFNAFDTSVSITLYCKANIAAAALDACMAACKRYEGLFSRTVCTSDIGRLNAAHGESVQIDSETYMLLRKAIHYCHASEGAFDITVAPASKLWDLKGHVIPHPDALDGACAHIGIDTLRLSDPAEGCFAQGLKTLLQQSTLEASLRDTLPTA